MKKNIRTKLFGLTLAAALALTTLTACGDSAGTATLPGTPSQTAPLQEENSGSIGTVLLSVNPEIEMDYDDGGNVVALNALNEDGRAVLAGYTGYEGRRVRPWSVSWWTRSMPAATLTPPWAARRRTSS